jgi:hypothetical protein
MFTRVGGATLALVAAVSLALSIAGAMGPLPGWWSGHPNVSGRVLKTKDVDIGLLSTKGCNTGGDKKCEHVEVLGTVSTTGYVAAGATGLLAVASMLLAIAAAVESERRRSIAKLAVFAVVVSSIVAIALVVQGPGIDARTPDGKLLAIGVPLGVGIYLFAAGMVTAIVASVLALRPARAQAAGAGPAAVGTGTRARHPRRRADDAVPATRGGRARAAPG